MPSSQVTVTTCAHLFAPSDVVVQVSRWCLQDELGPPALAFVRTVCAVLALDSAVEEQVAVLRRNLLKLVHVREFASAAEFKVRPYWPHELLLSTVLK